MTTALTTKALRIALFTQDAPMYMGPFMDAFLAGLNEAGHSLLPIQAFSPIFKKTLREEFVSRWRLYGTKDTLRLMLRILVEKIRARFYTPSRRCASLSNAAQKHGVQIQKRSSFNATCLKDWLKEQKVDLLISVACPHLLPAEILAQPTLGALNYHTGLLPWYRGRQPLFWALYNNESSFGITVHEMAPKLDAGAIVEQKSFFIEKKNSLHQLYLISIVQGPPLLLGAIKKLAEGDKSRLANNIKNKKLYPFPCARDGKEFRRRGNRFF